MKCPVCRVPLIAVEREQIEVDYCISCRGLWFDSGELNVLAEKVGVTLDIASIFGSAATTSERPRHCPRCGKKMEKSEMTAAPGIITDRCPENEGVWFDARELGLLLDRILTTAGPPRPVASFLGEMFGRRS